MALGRRERDGSLRMGDSDSDDYDGVAGEWSRAEGQSRGPARGAREGTLLDGYGDGDERRMAKPKTQKVKT